MKESANRQPVSPSSALTNPAAFKMEEELRDLIETDSWNETYEASQLFLLMNSEELAF